jgi:hypothetical protein
MILFAQRAFAALGAACGDAEAPSRLKKAATTMAMASPYVQSDSGMQALRLNFSRLQMRGRG